jgi:hypothetical protein
VAGVAGPSSDIELDDVAERLEESDADELVDGGVTVRSGAATGFALLLGLASSDVDDAAPLSADEAPSELEARGAPGCGEASSADPPASELTCTGADVPSWLLDGASALPATETEIAATS